MYRYIYSNLPTYLPKKVPGKRDVLQLLSIENEESMTQVERSLGAVEALR